MKTLFRTDSSHDIGTGHVMRCLTLARALQHSGVEVAFACRALPGNMIEYIRKQGFEVHVLACGIHEVALDGVSRFGHEAWLGVNWIDDVHDTVSVVKQHGPFDCLIVDHYAIDAPWEREVAQYFSRIIVIDDLADRKHDCDILIDQNLVLDAASRYRDLVPPKCVQLIGPKYALLREEFGRARDKIGQRTGDIARILVFYGGVDPTNETEKALHALLKLQWRDVFIDVVVGSPNPHREKIQELCASFPQATFHCQIPYMASLMASADLALGAGGSSSWERCFMQLPSITTIIAQNQLDITKAVEAAGATWCMGWHQDVTGDSIRDKLIAARESPDVMRTMSQVAAAIMEDVPGTQLVVQHICGGTTHDSGM